MPRTATWIGRAAALVALLAMATTPAAATESPKDAKAYFINLEDGMEVTSPLRVIAGLRNMGLAPANLDEFGKTGHHHLLIDAPLPPKGEPIPDEREGKGRYVHLGGGETEVVVELEPGKHELQLVMGDHEHVPHTPMVTSKRITIEVIGEAADVCAPLTGDPGSCKPADS
jgi:hypothetical protein